MVDNPKGRLTLHIVATVLLTFKPLFSLHSFELNIPRYTFALLLDVKLLIPYDLLQPRNKIWFEFI